MLHLLYAPTYLFFNWLDFYVKRLAPNLGTIQKLLSATKVWVNETNVNDGAADWHEL